MIPQEWSSLDVAQLIVDLLLPIVLIFLGFFIFLLERRIENKIDQGIFARNWTKDLYEAMARDLNIIFCGFNYVGDWRKHSPYELIASKRELDFCLHAYSDLFSDVTLQSYQRLMSACFVTERGRRSELLIRANVAMFKHSLYEWKDEYEQHFVTEEYRLVRSEFRKLYFEFKTNLFSDLGF